MQTQTHAAPGSSPFPPQGPVSVHGADQHEVAPGDIAVGVVIGRTSEYFDFFVYGIASALVFPSVFFPHLARLEGTLWSFAIFALAFLARPLGTVLFMWIQTRWDRGTKLTAALFAVNLVLPDPIPFVDELAFGLATLLLANWKRRKQPGAGAPPLADDGGR